MPFFTLRGRRIEVEIPVVVNLYDKLTDTLSTDQAAGTLVTLSKTGTSLVVEKMILGGDHLFFTAQKKAKNYLQLKGGSKEFAELNVLCRSVWMDSFTYREKSCFKVGLQFTEEQKTFFKLCKKSFF